LKYTKEEVIPIAGLKESSVIVNKITFKNSFMIVYTYLNNLFEINSCNCESDIFFFACAKVLASSPTVCLNKYSEEFEAFLIASSITIATSFGDGALFIAEK
jgi:hypothetical protein